MTLAEFISRIKTKADDIALKLLTPKEYKAVLLFLGIGFVVLLYRGGKELWYVLVPPIAPNSYVAAQRTQDSIFTALSTARIPEDSLKFWQPPNPSDTNEPIPRKNSKADGLEASSVSLNKGSKQELMRLPGVGEVMSERILTYRLKRGGFRQIEELMNVEGIGEKKFEKMKPYLKLN
ncbi:MAG TPA: helix-hairpin-helix domain-containing protein [Candidatus Kapabacteria bacterium]